MSWIDSPECRRGAFVLAVVLPVATTACDEEGTTCGLGNRDIAMFASINDTGMVTNVIVELREEGDDSLVLCAEDDEAILINGEKAIRESYQESHRYQLDFKSGPNAPREFEVTFRRKGASPSVKFKAPPHFSFKQPMEMEHVPRPEGLSVRWDAPPPENGPPPWSFQLELNEQDEGCIELEWGDEVPDTGRYEFVAGELAADPELPPGPCEAELSAVRYLEGPYPESMHPSGEVEAIVRRRVRFYTDP